ncbi:MAG: hypothetical protein H6734_15865 [Alphaproteobacteria bacterium]|nr:hypothetical protein [Alphaproteobacteria bacterium]
MTSYQPLPPPPPPSLTPELLQFVDPGSISAMAWAIAPVPLVGLALICCGVGRWRVPAMVYVVPFVPLVVGIGLSAQRLSAALAKEDVLRLVSLLGALSDALYPALLALLASALAGGLLSSFAGLAALLTSRPAPRSTPGAAVGAAALACSAPSLFLLTSPWVAAPGLFAGIGLLLGTLRLPAADPDCRRALEYRALTGIAAAHALLFVVLFHVARGALEAAERTGCRLGPPEPAPLWPVALGGGAALALLVSVRRHRATPLIRGLAIWGLVALVPAGSCAVGWRWNASGLAFWSRPVESHLQRLLDSRGITPPEVAEAQPLGGALPVVEGPPRRHVGECGARSLRAHPTLMLVDRAAHMEARDFRGFDALLVRTPTGLGTLGPPRPSTSLLGLRPTDDGLIVQSFGVASPEISPEEVPAVNVRIARVFGLPVTGVSIAADRPLQDHLEICLSPCWLQGPLEPPVSTHDFRQDVFVPETLTATLDRRLGVARGRASSCASRAGLSGPRWSMIDVLVDDHEVTVRAPSREDAASRCMAEALVSAFDPLPQLVWTAHRGLGRAWRRRGPAALDLQRRHRAPGRT